MPFAIALLAALALLLILLGIVLLWLVWRHVQKQHDDFDERK